MATKSVRLPDGTVVRKVPEEIPDEQVIEQYKDVWQKAEPVVQETVTEDQPTDEPSFLDKVSKFIGSRPSMEARRLERSQYQAQGKQLEESIGGAAIQAMGAELRDTPKEVGLDFAKVFYDKAAELKSIPMNVLLRTTPDGKKLLDLDPEIAKKLMLGSTPFVKPEEMYTAEGDLNLQTITGAIGDVGTDIALYAGTGKKIYDVMPAIPRVVRGLVAGVASDQMLADPEENIFNVVKDTWPESSVAAYTGFMASKETDPELLQRLKLVGEGLAFGALGELVGGLPVLAKKARSKYSKAYTQLTKEEKGEILVEHLEDVKREQGGWIESREAPEPEFFRTPVTDSQVAQQNSSGLNRFLRQVFTSRGYWTEDAYNAFQDSQYAQRAIVNKAQHISNRLQIELDNIVDSSESLETAKKVQNILSDDLSFIKGQSKKAAVQDLRDAYDLSPELASEVYNARQLIDEMSKNLVNSSAVRDELKEVIVENSGSYIRRSYRLYEDAGYKPDPVVRRDAQTFLANNILRSEPDKSIEEAYQKADNLIEEILGTAGKDAQVSDYIGRIRRINTNILKGRKDIPQEIRSLMGEIESPTENVMLTVSKMAQLSETSRFYDELYRLGKKGNYIFDEDAIRPSGLKLEQISGTNSNLDGKWTTSEILIAIKGEESKLIGAQSKGPLIDLYKNFLTLKGQSQKSKTVYSHVTHLRNIMGGAQFGVANGMNPFSNSRATMALLKNEISNAGQEGIDTIYEKYLRLGIINTNIRVNEFRELLDTGYESLADGTINKIVDFSKKNILGRKIAEGAETVEDFYLAVDDFYKINGYLSELDTLKRAYPDKSISELEEIAAAKIRATFPNYDRVPKGIKATRELPFGNFVAFPTEIVRTSYHVLSTAIDEIGSGNAVMMTRGLKRLAGFSASMFGWHGISKMSANLVGLTEEEKQALDVISETPWSKSSPRIYIRIGDKIHSADTQFLDSYSFIKEPLMIAYNEIATGKLQGKEAKEYIAKSLLEGVKKVITPYTDPAILSSAIKDVFVAADSEDGRTADGKTLFVSGMDRSEKIYNGAIHILEAFAPGSVSSINRAIDAFGEKPNEYTGRDMALEPELITNMSGIKFVEVSPEDRLKFALGAYQRYNRNVISSNVRYGQTGDSARETYYKRERQRYRNQQELFRVYDAVRTIIGNGEAIRILFEQDGISKNEKALLAIGKFYPEPVTENDVIRIIERVDTGDKSKSEVVGDIVRMVSGFIGTDLTFPEDRKEEDRKYFPKYAKGGEVFGVPKVPKEPDERIDKMTGLPYNVQAGAAFTDEEDRAGLSAVGNRGTFDSSSPIMKKAEGGFILNALKGAVQYAKGEKKKAINSIGKALGIGPKEQRLNERAAARAVNEAVDAGKIPERFRVGVDEYGFVKSLPDEELFNAVNHGLLSYRYGTNPVMRTALQIKEGNLFQGADKPVESSVDAFNNERGFELRKQGLSEEEALKNLIDDYAKASAKLNMGLPLVRGSDIILNRDDLINTTEEKGSNVYSGSVDRSKRNFKHGGKVLAACSK